jgi:hypothetical protein
MIERVLFADDEPSLYRWYWDVTAISRPRSSVRLIP